MAVDVAVDHGVRLLPPDTIVGITAEAASSATTVAVGWYAWRRGPVETDDAGQGTMARV